jgi:uncharacterized membrane protein YkvA (DUF1232 family)
MLKYTTVGLMTRFLKHRIDIYKYKGVDPSEYSAAKLSYRLNDELVDAIAHKPTQSETHATAKQLAANIRYYLNRFSGKTYLYLAAGILYFLCPVDAQPEAILGPLGFTDDVMVLKLCWDQIINDLKFQ